MQEQRIGSELGMLNNLLKRQMACQPQGEEISHVTGMQGMIIHYLSVADGDRFQKDVETQFRFRRSTATGILQLMEKNGLIVRESVASDARLKSLIPTERAAHLDAQIGDLLRKSEQRLTDGLSSEQLAQFLETAAHMAANLDD